MTRVEIEYSGNAKPSRIVLVDSTTGTVIDEYDRVSQFRSPVMQEIGELPDGEFNRLLSFGSMVFLILAGFALVILAVGTWN